MKQSEKRKLKTSIPFSKISETIASKEFFESDFEEDQKDSEFSKFDIEPRSRAQRGLNYEHNRMQNLMENMLNVKSNRKERIPKRTPVKKSNERRTSTQDFEVPTLQRDQFLNRFEWNSNEVPTFKKQNTSNETNQLDFQSISPFLKRMTFDPRFFNINTKDEKDEKEKEEVQQQLNQNEMTKLKWKRKYFESEEQIPFEYDDNEILTTFPQQVPDVW